MEQIRVKKIWKEEGQEIERVMTIDKDRWERVVKENPDKNVRWEKVGASPAKAKETVLIGDDTVSTKKLAKKEDEVITQVPNNNVQETSIDYSTMTEEQIREIAKQRGVRGFSIIKIETLIETLKQQNGSSSSN